jgi:hypothetical protein
MDLKKTTIHDDTENYYTGNDSMYYPDKQSNHLAILLLKEKVNQFKKELDSIQKKRGYMYSLNFEYYKNRKNELSKCISELELSIYKLKSL